MPVDEGDERTSAPSGETRVEQSLLPELPESDEDSEPPPPPTTRAGKALRAGRRLLEAVLLLAVFASGLVGAALLHLDASAVRRLVASVATDLLSREFEGTVVLSGIEELHWDRIEVTTGTVIDPDGNTVLTLTGIKLRADVPDTVRKLVWGEGKVDVPLEHIRVDRVDVELLTDAETKQPTIARAFTPVPSKKPPKPSTGPPRYLRVWLPTIEIGKGYVRQRMKDAPQFEARLGQIHGSVLSTPKGVAVDVDRFGTVVTGLTEHDAEGTGTVKVRVPGAFWASFDGYFGDVEIGAFASLDDGNIVTRLELPYAEAADIRAVLPQWPLNRDVRGQLEARGTLDELKADLTLVSGDMSIDAKGKVGIGKELSAKIDIDAKHVDVGAFVDGAPKTDFRTAAYVDAWTKDGAVTVDVNARTFPTTVEGFEVPNLDLTGRANDEGFDGTATLHEPGLPVKVDYTFHPSGKVDLKIRTRSFSLTRAKRLRPIGARGDLQLDVDATIRGSDVEASATGNARGFEFGPLKLASASVRATASGKATDWKRLRIYASASGDDIRMGTFGFDRVRAKAVGPLERPRVQLALSDQFDREVVAKGTVSYLDGTRVTDAELGLKRGKTEIKGSVSRFELNRGEVDIENLELTGSGGSLSGSARIREDRLQVVAKGRDLDLAAFSYALGLPRGTLEGRMVLDADVTIDDRRAEGNVRIGLRDGTLGPLPGVDNIPVPGVSLALDAELRDRDFEGSVQGQIAGLASFGALWDGRLAGAALDGDSWRGATGNLNAQLSEINLDWIGRALPKSAPVRDLSGRVFAQIQAERSEPDQLPNLRVLTWTRQLKLEATPGTDSKPLRLDDYEVQVSAAANGRTGVTQPTTRLIYRGEVLAETTGSLTYDYDQLIDDPSRARELLMRAPLALRVALPERKSESLPEFAKLEGVSAKVGGSVLVSGTPDRPVFDAHADLSSVRSTDSRYGTPMDVSITGRYERATSALRSVANVSVRQRRVAVAELEGKLLEKVVDEKPILEWHGKASLDMQRVPLRIVPALADSNVGGRISGKASVTTHENGLPKVEADVRISGAQVDLVPLGDGTVRVSNVGRQLNAKLDFKSEHGRLTTTANGVMVWRGLLPAMEPGSPVLIRTKAQHFDAIVLLPFLRDAFTELAGDVTANLVTVLQPKETDTGETEWTGRIEGDAEVENGVMQFAVLGMKLEGVHTTVKARSASGTTSIAIERFEARARSEEPNVSAAGTVILDDLAAVKGAARVRGTDVPLVLEGVTYGKATGNLLLEMTRAGKNNMNVDVRVPDMTIKMPRSSSRNVHQIDDNKSISIVQPIREPTDEKRDADSMKWRIAIDLQGNVRVVRGDMDIPLRGKPVLELKDETEVSGYIDLPAGGRLPALGKVFIIERGTARFDNQEATNPHIQVTASWRSPDGTIVYVDVIGTLEDAELSVRSDPPMSEPEIFALLLGGPTNRDGNAEGNAAASAAGSLGAVALGELLSDTPFSGVEFRTQSSAASAPRYTAAVKLRDNLWFEATYVEGQSASSSDLSSESQQADFVGAVDWRFHENWSLRSEMGGSGSMAFDLLWQYRY